MKDIFISYAKKDRAVTETLAALFSEQGWSVWWDRDIPLGQEYDRAIEEALLAAKCVVVLWSKSSVESDWVRSEAEEAHRHGTIIPALIDDVSPPLAFRRIQAADLTRWKGESDLPEIVQLLGQIAALLQRGTPVELPGKEPDFQSTKPRKIKRLARAVGSRKPLYVWISLGGVAVSLIAMSIIWWTIGRDIVSAPDTPSPPEPEIQRQIDALVELGDSHLEIGFLIEPPGSNAYDSYEQVLKLDPENLRARAGMRRIGDKMEALAIQSRDRGDIVRGMKLVEEGLRILPDHAGLLALKRTMGAEQPR